MRLQAARHRRAVDQPQPVSLAARHAGSPDHERDRSAARSPARSREAAAARGGRALVVGGWVRDRLPGRGVEGPRPRDLRHRRNAICPRCSRRSAASSRSGAAFPSTRSPASTSRCRDASRRSGRGHTAFAVEGDPCDAAARGRTAARLHHQRDRVGPAHRRVRGPVRRARRSRRRRAARRRSAHVRRRQPARAAGAAVRRALRAHGARGDARDLRRASRSTICRPSASGASSRSCCCRRAGRRSASRSRASWRRAPALAGDGGAHRLRAGTRVASRRRRVGPHADGHRPGARRASTTLRTPSRSIVMLGAVCHDFGKPATTAFIDGRIRSIGHEEAGVAPATAFLDRLNIHSIDGVDVRTEVLGIVAHHLKPGMWHKVRDEVGRRRVPAARAEGEPRAAGGAREGRLHGPHRRVRLLGDGLVPRARACARRRASAARRAWCWAATCCRSASRPDPPWDGCCRRSTRRSSMAR